MRIVIVIIALLAGMGSAEPAEYQPDDVRPWAAYVAARKAANEVNPNVNELPMRVMVERLGPLPWRFNVEADTPFTSPAVVNRLYVRREYDGAHWVITTRASFEYPENKGALSSEDFAVRRVISNISPSQDGSKYLWSAPGGYYR